MSDQQPGTRQVASPAVMSGSRPRRGPHSALVIGPIVCWTSSLAVDVLSRFTADPSFLVRTSTWLAGIGILTAVVAGIAGFVEGASIPAGTRTYRRLLVHLVLVLVTMVFIGFTFLLRLASQHGQPATPRTIILAATGLVLVVAVAAVGRGLSRRRRPDPASDSPA